MNVVVVKYNAGNIASVVHSLQRIGASVRLSDKADEISVSERVIFPGVGEASSAMAYLRSCGLDQVLPRLRQPVLGICLGMQLMCTYSEENDTHGMGIFSPYLKKFNDSSLSVPHMGWNRVSSLKGPLFKGIKDDSYVYFAHSYHASPASETAASCRYGTTFSAALHKDNFYGVQFHPEKSTDTGERILRNFLSV